MNTYGATHAQLYNLFYKDKPYADEARFVHLCISRFTNRPAQHILELACGTGNHAFALEPFGYTILSTDISKDMLASAGTKQQATRSKIIFRQMDMRKIDVPPESFDAVVALFDSIGYAHTNHGIHAVLSGVVHALRPGGVFVFEFWHAAAMLRFSESVRVRRCKTPSGASVTRISETRLNIMEGTAEVRYSIFEPTAVGTLVCHEELHVNRFFLVPEMESYLERAGLTPLAWFAGFDEDKPIDDSTWHIVAVVQKSPTSH